MREYTDKAYIELIEKTKDPTLQKHMAAEVEEILKVKSAKGKTFIDLGAGHGRVLPQIAEISKNVISIELNISMLPELKRRTAKAANSEIIVGNIVNLSKLLKGKEVHKPVLLLLQNTLGTIEGDWKQVLLEMKQVAQENKGEIIISLFRSEALASWGVAKLYPSVSKMVGVPDRRRTNFEKGMFKSSTGYSSKWWSKEEIEAMKQFLQGTVVNETWADEFYVLHLQYD